jgi:hypothetical protein
MAKQVAELIRTRRKNKADLAPESMEDLPAKELKSMGFVPESKQWRRNYSFLGQVFCEFDKNPADFLRLVADVLEGKGRYSPGEDWYDNAITLAYKQAGRRRRWRPSFSEFHNVFRAQNPKLQGASERSLRRSLKRLGYRTEPAKPGRPKKNRDRKPLFGR